MVIHRLAIFFLRNDPIQLSVRDRMVISNNIGNDPAKEMRLLLTGCYDSDLIRSAAVCLSHVKRGEDRT